MTVSRFCHYQHRSIDPQVAYAFYLALLGPDILFRSDLSFAPLPERAALAGAPAHWLGFLGVADVEHTAARIASLGGERLGPTPPVDAAPAAAVVRDPFGAVLALCPPTAALRPSPFAWHVLHTNDHGAAFSMYSGLFGWFRAEGPTPELSDDLGEQTVFQWEASTPAEGFITSAARSPKTHPHWLFCFRVPDMRSALDRLNALGTGEIVAAESRLGAVVVAAEDKLGGAFALYQPPPGAR